MSVPAHHATTRHLGAVYPFASEAGLGGRGVLIGRDLLGGAFVDDPFELYRTGLLTKVSIKAGCKAPAELARCVRVGGQQLQAQIQLNVDLHFADSAADDWGATHWCQRGHR